eukprot:gene15859-24237_t
MYYNSPMSHTQHQQPHHQQHQQQQQYHQQQQQQHPQSQYPPLHPALQPPHHQHGHQAHQTPVPYPQFAMDPSIMQSPAAASPVEMPRIDMINPISGLALKPRAKQAEEKAQPALPPDLQPAPQAAPGAAQNPNAPANNSAAAAAANSNNTHSNTNSSTANAGGGDVQKPSRPLSLNAKPQPAQPPAADPASSKKDCGCRRNANPEGHTCNTMCENIGCDKSCGVAKMPVGGKKKVPQNLPTVGGMRPLRGAMPTSLPLQLTKQAPRPAQPAAPVQNANNSQPPTQPPAAAQPSDPAAPQPALYQQPPPPQQQPQRGYQQQPQPPQKHEGGSPVPGAFPSPVGLPQMDSMRSPVSMGSESPTQQPRSSTLSLDPNAPSFEPKSKSRAIEIVNPRGKDTKIYNFDELSNVENQVLQNLEQLKGNIKPLFDFTQKWGRCWNKQQSNHTLGS